MSFFCNIFLSGEAVNVIFIYCQDDCFMTQVAAFLGNSLQNSKKKR